MNTLIWFVYLIDVLYSVETFVIVVGTVLLIIALFLYLAGWHERFLYEDSEKYEQVKELTEGILRTAKKLFIGALILSIIALAIPSKKTMYVMLGLKTVEIVSQIEPVKDLIPKSVEVVEAYLDKKLKEFTEEGKKDPEAK